ncbi:cbb3-type cytochrome c oxidase N-terminal domain-containing protein [Marixanthomonas spongiae]|uniref:Cytochrome C oxidase subunit III n=1 Tax=Marixanthomonas spongiae TaxID=2174845 RepID=A0A2U0I3Y6_9FLAO|nr:cbb3-type cytochrome c oxidase N-terminal domain-containing protein [Marixanthomonas spongiae]PVW15823.1 cytochrome C oxidase subunit III [Marixanthomonas spongiae]
MKTTASYLRLIGIMVLAFFLMEFIVASGDDWAIIKYPVIWAVLGLVFLFAIAVEVISETLNSILFRGMNEEAQERYLAAEAHKKENNWFKKTYEKLLAKKPIEKEEDIVLDHNYDGIRELDNVLPPWWVYMFYATIIFAVVYLVRYHVFDGIDQEEEYEIAVAEARAQIEEYKKTAKDLIDVNTVELLTGEQDIAAGKTVFEANCVACHKVDGGGGIGPNLVDDYWILGGGIKNVFNTISEGGRAGKGMVAWKTDLKPSEMAQVASYVLSLHGTTPADPKDPEGDLWVDPNAPVEEVEVEQIDSTKIQVKIEDQPVTGDVVEE